MAENGNGEIAEKWRHGSGGSQRQAAKMPGGIRQQPAAKK